jgi:hypothetical protein
MFLGAYINKEKPQETDNQEICQRLEAYLKTKRSN